MKTPRQFTKHIALICYQAIDFLGGDVLPHHIAAGFAAGLVLGFFPPLTLQWVFVALATLLLRLNTAVAAFSALSAYLISPWVDPLFHNVGYFALTLPGTHSFYANLQNAPVLAFARLNNTVVMGSLLVLAVVAPVLFGVTRRLAEDHTWRLLNHIDNSPIWNRILRVRVVQSYFRYRRDK